MKKKLIMFSLICFTLSLYSIKYKITEFDNVKIYSQESISEEIIEKFNNYFEIAYKSIGTDLGFPETKPKIYIYQTDNELYDELLNTRQYPAWFKTYNVLPRMNKDYEMWAIMNKDIKFIAHEYSHRLIEQIAGINSQVNFKWLDEGLAEYEGIQALSIYDSKKGLDKKEQFLKSTIDFYKNGILVKIRDMTTEDQWTKGMKEYQDKYYIQSYIMINYLVEEFGIIKIKKLLELIQKETIFSNAFKKVYGISLNEFEKNFSIHLEKIKIEKEKNKAALKFDFTKDNNEWENINPIIDDKNDNIDIPEADIRNIHAEIFKDQLYILFTTESKINTKSLIAYCIYIDIDNDKKPDYQIGFNILSAWLWILRDAGINSYNDNNNLIKNIDCEKYFGKTIKFMIPTKYFENSNTINIKLYSFQKNILLNPDKNWIKVEYK